MAYRGEMAPLNDKNEGNENQSSFDKYKVTVEFDGSEFYCRMDVGGRSWNFRNMSYDGLRDEVHRFFPRAKFSFKRSRSAELALNPAAAAMQGPGGRW